MLKKHLKINETALAVIVLSVVALPIFNDYRTKENIERDLQTQEAKNATTKAENEAFIAKYNEQEANRAKLELLIERYREFPLDRDVVSEYAYQLTIMNRSEDAFEAIDKYFKEIPKEGYSDDIEMWVAHAIASLNTKRCITAMADGWHIKQRVVADSEEQEFVDTIFFQALHEEKCVER